MSGFYIAKSSLSTMSSGEVKKYIGQQKVAVKSAVKANENATTRAAYATYLAEHVTHEIYQSKGEGMTGEEWAASFGLTSKSVVTGWRTLGHALLAVGLDPEGPTYTRLRNSNVYGRKPVKEAIFAEGATESSILAVLDLHADADGKRLPDPSKPQAEGKPGTGEDKGEGEAPMTVEGFEACDAAVKVLAKHMGDLSDAEFLTIAKRLTAVVKKEQQIRDHAAKKSA